MKLTKIMLGVACLAVLVSGALVWAFAENEKETKHLAAFNYQYAEPLTWDSLINENSDLIIRGTIESTDGHTKVMELDNGTLYVNRYTIKVEENIKAAQQASEQALKLEQAVEVLENIDPGIKVGNEVVVFAKLKKNGAYSPVGEYGLFVVENGIAHGQLVGKDANEIPVAELLDTVNKVLEASSLK